MSADSPDPDHRRLRPASALALLPLLACCAAGLGRAQEAESSVPPDRLLLKDYRPRSIFNVPQTPIHKARFPAIDAHSHVYASNAEEVGNWVRAMDEVGVEKTVILVSSAGPAFDDAVKLFAPRGARFELWCGLDLADAAEPGFAARAVAELERCHRLGARGVGELVDKGRGLMFAPRSTRRLRGAAELQPAPGLHLDDPRLDAVLERCADLGLPVNVHVAEPRWMYEPMDRSNDGLMSAFQWRIPNEAGVLSFEEAIATLDRAATRHPRTTFIACHLANAGHDLSILARLLEAHANLHADIGARFGEIGAVPRHAARFFERFQDRLLFGTDLNISPEMYRHTFRILESEDEHFYPEGVNAYHWPVHGLGLKDEVLRKLYGGNARRLMTPQAARPGVNRP